MTGSQTGYFDSEPQTDRSLAGGVLDFLRPPPILVTAQGYRTQGFSQEELSRLRAHQDSWQALLFRHGIVYDATLLDGRKPEYVDLIYHFSATVDPDSDPYALPLLLDALYEMKDEFPDVEWEVHSVEAVVTRLPFDERQKGITAGGRVFPQHVKGQPAPLENDEIL